MTARVLTIAGSDSSGGAGIQQDLKVFHALGVRGATAVTSITAQTFSDVERRNDLHPAVVVAQIRAAAKDGLDAVKTGMLATAEIVEAVAGELAELALPLVVDPVLASGSGTPLLDDDAIELLRTKLIPLADCVTPNRDEAELLAVVSASDRNGQRSAARAILDLGARSVVVTGGHIPGPHVVDVLAYAGAMIEITGPRIEGGPAHGTGCAFSAALAAHLALGADIENAARKARGLVEEGLRRREGAALGLY